MQQAIWHHSREACDGEMDPTIQNIKVVEKNSAGTR